MKKLLFCMIVCAGFAACTSDDVVIGSGGATDFEGGDIYMKVYISDVASGTRGTGTDTDEKSSNYGSNVYANGTANEYDVKDAEFYFYDKDGVFISRASVWDELADGAGVQSEGSNVTFKSANMIVLKGLTSKQLPKYMVTILNEPSGFEDAGTFDPANTLGELEQKLVSGITTTSNSTDYFIMSTSSYTDSTTDASGTTTAIRSAGGEVKNYFVTEIDESNFLEEPIESVSSYDSEAVQVYVERLAAKVSVDTSIESSTTGYITGDDQTSRTFYVVEQTVAGTANDDEGQKDMGIDGIYVTFLGWTLNATARQSYIMKNVDDEWNSEGYWSGTWNVDTYTWNDSTRYRSYWGKGIAYGTGGFPESNIKYKDIDEDGNVDITVQTDKEEQSTTSSDWLNPYLQYTSLDESTATIQEYFGDSYPLYCAENTNVVDGEGIAGLKDLYSSGITSVLLKAQACTYNEETSTYDPLALVRYNGELFTADEFKNTVVRQDVNFDFTHATDLAKDELSGAIAEYLETVYNYLEPEIYVAKKSETPQTFATFDGSFLSLVDIGDGNVGVWPNTTTAKHTNSTTETWTDVDTNLSAYWNGQIIDGYKAKNDLDEYDIYFKTTCSETDFKNVVLYEMGNIKITIGTLFKADGQYVAADDGTCYFLMDDEQADLISNAGTAYYTLRQYFIRAIEKEALQTNLYFLGYELQNSAAHTDYTYVESGDGVIETNFYKDGLMYYSIPIEHLVEASTTGKDDDTGTTGEETGTTSKKTIIDGQYGVVRNHWYQLEITSLSKLGRGISDETAVIIPDPNGTDYLSVVANVNINAWQTVKQQKGL